MMTIQRWTPFWSWMDIQKEVSHLFDDVLADTAETVDDNDMGDKIPPFLDKLIHVSAAISGIGMINRKLDEVPLLANNPLGLVESSFRCPVHLEPG